MLEDARHILSANRTKLAKEAIGLIALCVPIFAVLYMPIFA